MIILGSYISAVLAVILSVLTVYLYWKEDERYKYTGLAAIVFGVIAILGLSWFITAFS